MTSDHPRCKRLRNVVGGLMLSVLGLIGGRLQRHHAPRQPRQAARKLEAQPYRPHILFVVMDDLGSNDLGYHGSGIETPVADEIAMNGLRFKSFYTLPTCSTTRMALMTGRYPYRSGHYEVIREVSAQGLPLDEETLPQVLRTAGYRTAAIGKWHLGHARYEQTPTFRGFQSFFGFHVGGRQDYFEHTSEKKHFYDMRHEPWERCGPGCSRQVDARGQYSSQLYAREANNVIDYHDRNHPLFLYLAFQAVHRPLQVPGQYIEQYRSKGWASIRSAYAGMLTAADEALGAVIDKLKERQIWENTLVIYMTDNGGIINGKIQLNGKQVVQTLASNGISRGQKSDVWEGGVLGEAFIGGPALSKLGIDPGDHEPIFHTVDWLPTLAAAMGAKRNGHKQLDGINQFPVLKGDTPPNKTFFLGYSVSQASRQGHFGSQGEYTAARWRQYKLVRFPSKAKFALYDLKADPSENNDISALRPQIVRRLRQFMQDYERRFSAPAPNDKTCPAMTPDKTSWGEACWKPWC